MVAEMVMSDKTNKSHLAHCKHLKIYLDGTVLDYQHSSDFFVVEKSQYKHYKFPPVHNLFKHYFKGCEGL